MNFFCSMRVRRSRISSPYSALPPTTIFRPLYSGGLWLPLTATQLPQFRWCAAKYASGVGPMPTSITSQPPAVSPSISALASSGPESRPSRQMANVGAPRSRANVPSARPISRTNGAVSERPTIPRMS